MRIGAQTSLFFDAPVLVAGAHSPTGGSALLLEACKAGGLKAQTTSLILLEALNALRRFPQRSLDRFYQQLAGIDWELLPAPSAETLRHYERYVAAKDVHVLAAAVEGKAEFLLTLHRRHILAAAEAVEGAHLPIIILRPGDFIRQYYRQHQDYPSLSPATGETE